jgi:hypothetical protein
MGKGNSILRNMTLLCVLSLFGAQGCASPASYMGISLVSTEADPELQRQAYLAKGGDKQALLALGIRFEKGLGVARDLDKARKLYRQAAADSGGTIWVYSPPVGNGTSGRVIPVNAGARQIGLIEAKRRLEALEK